MCYKRGEQEGGWVSTGLVESGRSPALANLNTVLLSFGQGRPVLYYFCSRGAGNELLCFSSLLVYLNNLTQIRLNEFQHREVVGSEVPWNKRESIETKSMKAIHTILTNVAKLGRQEYPGQYLDGK